MFTYTTLSTEDESIRLSAILTETGYKYPALSFYTNNKIREMWSDKEQLFNVFAYLSGNVENEDISGYVDNHKEELIKMFSKAGELGFFT